MQLYYITLAVVIKKHHFENHKFIIMKKSIFILISTFLALLHSLSAQTISQKILDNAFPPDLVTPSGQIGYTLNESISTFDNSKWHPNWDEANVFKTELEHDDYSLRIGQGGQLYSIETPIGEICPPQWQEHAWVDDTWLLTTYQYDLKPVPGSNNNGNEFTAFIHQCGIYPHIDAGFQQGNQFWTPMLAEHWDADNNAYSTLSLGMISSGPSYNRADVLMYQKTRDLGDGIFEVVYMAYNYNTSYTEAEAQENYNTDFSPWGGVRESKLPDHIMSNPDGSWSVVPSFGLNNITSNITGGWAINAEDANDGSGYALGYVFGKEKPAETNLKFYSHGSTGAERDFNVQALVYRQPFRPGNIFYCRLYFVLGELDDVIEKCNALEPNVEAGFLDYGQVDATRIPLYLDELDGQTVIVEDGDTPAFYVYAEPVKDSKPLYLIRNNDTNQLHATCDPYMIMPKYPIPNSNPAEEGWRPYDGTTEIIKIYGYVMPEEFIDESINYVRLDSVLTDVSYYPQDGLYDIDIMVEADVNTSVDNTFKNMASIFPNPTSGKLGISLSNSSNSVTIRVLDTFGKVLIQNQYSHDVNEEIEININHLANSIYYLQIITETGNQTEKILLQK